MLVAGLIVLCLVLTFFSIFFLKRADVEATLAETRRMQLRQQDNRISELCSEISREEYKMLEALHRATDFEEKARLVIEDAKQRMEDFKKRPSIACMTDQQVLILSEMISAQIREILDSPKEYVN